MILLKPTKNNSFQIISGDYRGRKFHFPDAQGLRPTPGKVRETLFNWIQFQAYGKTYLDLFAGSGALSLEALSRGAKSVLSVEKDPKAYQMLVDNAQTLQAENLQVLNQDALSVLSRPSQVAYDFVFLDPPFNQGLLAKALALLSQHHWTQSGTQLYLESEFAIDHDFLDAHFAKAIKINKQKQAGAVYYCLTEVL